MDGRARLLLAAARCELGLAFTPDLVRAADEVLAAGLYTPAVHELSQQGEGLVHSEALAFLRRALAEAGLAPLTAKGAAWVITRAAAEAIVAGEPPRPHVIEIDRADKAAERHGCGWGQSNGPTGLDAPRLLAIEMLYYSPECSLDGDEWVEFADEAARLTHLDRRAREEARAWLDRHPD